MLTLNEKELTDLIEREMHRCDEDQIFGRRMRAMAIAHAILDHVEDLPFTTGKQ